MSIGEEATATRKRSDQVFRYIIRPVVESLGYVALRADQISKPGVITTQLLEHLVEDPLVVADLTDHNANVFYELAVRHMTRKPLIKLIQTGQPLPFDVAHSRTIPFDIRDLDSVDACKEEMIKQITAGEPDSENLLTMSLDLATLRKKELENGSSDATVLRVLSAVVEAVQSLNQKIDTLDRAQYNFPGANWLPITSMKEFASTGGFRMPHTPQQVFTVNPGPMYPDKMALVPNEER